MSYTLIQVFMKSNKNEFQIKKLHGNDLAIFKKLILLFHDIFKTENRQLPNSTYLKKMLNNSEFICMAVICDHEVIGGLTAYELPMYYSSKSEIFIYDVAIQAENQRKGIGKKLITALREYSSKNRISEIFVAANVVDKHALKFYTAIGGIAEKVMHFNLNVYP
jgi:aminoglycoside 3-N-acetyltransferase I